MKKLLYVCEADSGGIMEYAIRQSAALVNQGVEVHFLCKDSFPKERLAGGIRVREFGKSRGARDERRASKKQARGLVGKIGRVINMISDLRAHSKLVAEMAEQFAFSPSPVELTEKDTKRREKGRADLTTEHTESTEDRFVTKQGSAWASQAGASESDSLASELADSPVSESLNRSAIGSASESSTSQPLPPTRNNLGEAEVAVLFACYKEYFAPFWVWPLRRLAKKGVVIGTIAHDPVRDFVVGPLWWHRWSVRLGYSFVRYVFVHDDTPVDFGGKRPDGIQVHQIPHGPYEVAEPKIGRLEMRRRLGFSAANDTNIHEVGKIIESKIIGSPEEEAGAHFAGRSGASEPNSLASELADSPASESLTRSASGPAGAHIAPTDRISQIGDRGIGSVGVDQFADSSGFLEGQSQAGLQMDSQNHQSIRVANNPGASGEQTGSDSESVKFDSLDPSRLTLRADLRSLDDLHRPRCCAPLGPTFSCSSFSFPKLSVLAPAPALDCEIRGSNSESLDSRLSTLDTSAPADFVFLAFGQIRDGKNLDLFLRAMTRLPNHVKLLVAGKGDSGSSRPPEFYQNLAEELGVADRCRWDIQRIPDKEVGDIFVACDVVLVTYSSKFRSASGVLNAAVSARKPVLASSGSGPLKTVVEKYHLGVFVEPDDLEEVLRGSRQLMDELAPPTTHILDTRHSTLDTCFPAAWDRYESDNSWKENATAVMNLLSSSSGNS
jgi:glycosyltransferase involved in cell wall biosynthesis